MIKVLKIISALPAFLLISTLFPAVTASAAAGLPDGSAAHPFSITVTRFDASDSSPGYISLELSPEQAFAFQDNIFLPGDSVSSKLSFENLADRTASFGISSRNQGDASYFNIVRLRLSRGNGNGEQTVIYDGSLGELNIPILFFLDSGDTADVNAELYIPASVNDSSLLSGHFDADLCVSGRVEDFVIITYKNGTQDSAGCYRSLHDGNYYYASGDRPVLWYQDVPRGSVPDYGNDLRVYIGSDNTPGTEDDRLVHAGADGVYDTEDDFIDLENGMNLRPGSDRVFGTQDDMLFSNGENGIPGDSDDRFLSFPNRPAADSGTSSGTAAGNSSGSNSSGDSGSPTYPDFGGRVYAGRLGPAALPVSYTGLKGGSWTLSDEKRGRWTYSYNGFTPQDQWVYILWEGTNKSGWYYFNSEGIMQTGWQLMKNGRWYHLHTVSDGMLGRMDTGFFFENEDRSWYYLDPVLGYALTGWQYIEEKWYCFNSAPGTQSWFWESHLGRWVYKTLTAKPYAAMYCNEKTPDGYMTDKNGASPDYGVKYHEVTEHEDTR